MRLKPLYQVIGLFLIYVFFYVILSLIGKYSDRLIISGKTTLGDIPVADIVVWEAKYVTVYPYKTNFLGKVYYPLVFIDRKYIHKDINIFDYFDKKDNKK